MLTNFGRERLFRMLLYNVVTMLLCNVVTMLLCNVVTMLLYNVVTMFVHFLFQLLVSVDNPVKTPRPGVVSFLCFVCRDQLSNATLCDAK